MIDYDLIIITNTMDFAVLGITQQCIDTALNTAGDKKVHVIVVETGSKLRDYENVDVNVLFEEEFKYNAALNFGLRYRKGKVQLLANNDLIFREGWAETGYLMEANNVLSASLLSRSIYHKRFKKGYVAYDGYRPGYELAGWLIFTHNKLWDIIKELPTNHAFWFSDNDYADRLKEHGIKHYLMCHAIVEHIESYSTKKLDKEKAAELTYKEGLRYGNKRISQEDIQIAD